MRLSAVLAVRNEEPMIERGLQLLGFCDEIVVVVDARTDDRTEEIARRYTDKVWVEEFEDFAAHKNSANAHAQGDWLLLVDADERVTPGLAADIQAALDRDPGEWGFEFEIVSFFLGQRMRYGGWQQDHLRLVRREHATWAGAIHEHLSVPPERVGRLDGELWHFSHRSIQEMLVKTVRFGDVQSRELHENGRAAGHRPHAGKAAGAGVRVEDGPPARLQGRHGGDHRVALPAVLALLRAGDAVAATAARDAVGDLPGP